MVSDSATIFNEFIRSLEGGPPDDATCDALWQALRSALISEMKRRALWNTPPSYLGIFGGGSWSQEDALNELLSECYVFIFVRRLRSLRAHMKVKADLTGLIFLNIRHFLYDTQKKFDPLGFRVFDVLQAAIRQAVAGGALCVLEGDAAIRNETVLGFSMQSRTVAGGAVRDLDETIRAWNDDLLPELVTARGRDVEPVLARLRDHVVALRDQGFFAFRFKDLVDPLKNDVRLRWGSVLRHEDGEVAFEDGGDDVTTPVRLVHPDLAVEQLQSFQDLLGCIAEGLGGLAVSRKTRGYLSKLWVFQRQRAADLQEDEPVSRRKLAEQLSIPRYLLPELFTHLGQLVEQCKESGS